MIRLLLWGKERSLVRPAYAEAYRKHIPQAELQWIEDAAICRCSA